jgi:DNA-directed RNA polymerase specialized sigma24 family protein
MRYTHSRDEAQDLLHDGFIKVFANLHTIRQADA